VAAGIFFTVYESSKTVFGNALPSSIPQPLVHALASGTAELSSCLVLTPAEVIKQNAQMIRRQARPGSGSSSHTSTSLQAWRMIASQGGPGRRLLTGYTALVARNLPFTALQFPMFEAVRARIWRYRDERRSRKQAGGVESGQGVSETGVVNGLSAGMSGAVAAFITTPTDVIKTRMMLSAGDHGAGRTSEGHSGGTTRRKGVMEVAREVRANNGVRGLFRGGGLRAFWTALSSGLYLGTYEMAKVWLKDGKGKDADDGF